MPTTPKYQENWWFASDDPPRTATRFWYYSLHLPSGVAGRQLCEVFCMNDIIFFRLLNMWNRSKPGVSQYWSEYV